MRIDKKTILILSAAIFSIGGIGVFSTITFAGFAKQAELKDGSNNLAVVAEPLSYSFKVQLNNANLVNANGGQRIYVIFYKTNIQNGAENGINTSNTIYTYIHCNKTWDDVTMDYSVTGISRQNHDRVMIARINPGADTSNLLSDIQSTLNTTTSNNGVTMHVVTGCVWAITSSVEIVTNTSSGATTYNLANDYYRAYWLSGESDSNYYHLEFNPKGTPNNP